MILRGMEEHFPGVSLITPIRETPLGITFRLYTDRPALNLSLSRDNLFDGCLVPITVLMSLVSFFPIWVAFILCARVTFDLLFAFVPALENSSLSSPPDDVEFIFDRHGKCLLR